METMLIKRQKIKECAFLFCLFPLILLAQNNTQNDFWNHVRFGGGIGLSFGDGFFSGTLAPSAIYQFNEQFALGLGLTGTYNEQKDIYKSTVLGGSLIGLFSPINEIQLSAELEQLHINQDFNQNFVINPDSYINSKNERIKGCFSKKLGFNNKKEWTKRTSSLLKIIKKHLNTIPTKELTIEELYYNNFD